jgi:hypothetical protein
VGKVVMAGKGAKAVKAVAVVPPRRLRPRPPMYERPRCLRLVRMPGATLCLLPALPRKAVARRRQVVKLRQRRLVAPRLQRVVKGVLAAARLAARSGRWLQRRP